jgi:glycosyltransferase involved in cell wall biosynthesis
MLPWSLHLTGGVNQVIKCLSKTMQEDGRVSPMVLVNDWKALTPQFESYQGIPVVRWRVMEPQGRSAFKDRLKYNLWMKFFGYQFRKFCIEHRVAAINPHFPGRMAFSIANTIEGMEKRPTMILSYHGSDVEEIKSWSDEDTKAWHALSKRIDMSVACSKNLASELINKLQSQFNIKVIPNGINPADFGLPPDIEIKKSIDKQVRILLNIGNFEPVKGQDVLLQAFAQICSKENNVHLAMVGRDKGTLSYLRSIAVELGLSEKVSFNVDIPHERIDEFYRMADAFILPSRREGFPLVILEAALFGLPVISSRVGGVPEIIQDQNHGFLVDPENPSILAQTITDVLKDSSRAREAGFALQARVKSMFTWEVACRKYLELIGLK